MSVDFPRVLCDSWCESLRVLVDVSAGAVSAGDGGIGRGRTGRAGGTVGTAGMFLTSPQMLSPMLDTGDGFMGDIEADVFDVWLVLSVVVEALVWDVSEAWSELAR